jgi:hypothetical protein
MDKPEYSERCWACDSRMILINAPGSLCRLAVATVSRRSWENHVIGYGSQNDGLKRGLRVPSSLRSPGRKEDQGCVGLLRRRADQAILDMRHEAGIISITCGCGQRFEAQLYGVERGQSRCIAECSFCGRRLRRNLPKKALRVVVPPEIINRLKSELPSSGTSMPVNAKPLRTKRPRPAM